MQVLREGKATEESEHVGKGPPEVTAAHIDEAWWVMRRRVRRSRYPVLEVIVWVLQVPGASGIGVGATAVQQTWGAVVFVAGSLVKLVGFLVEVHLSRKD
jgi:hypothetical protein